MFVEQPLASARSAYTLFTNTHASSATGCGQQLQMYIPAGVNDWSHSYRRLSQSLSLYCTTLLYSLLNCYVLYSLLNYYVHTLQSTLQLTLQGIVLQGELYFLVSCTLVLLVPVVPCNHPSKATVSSCTSVFSLTLLISTLLCSSPLCTKMHSTPLHYCELLCRSLN